MAQTVTNTDQAVSSLSPNSFLQQYSYLFKVNIPWHKVSDVWCDLPRHGKQTWSDASQGQQVLEFVSLEICTVMQKYFDCYLPKTVNTLWLPPTKDSKTFWLLPTKDSKYTLTATYQRQ